MRLFEVLLSVVTALAMVAGALPRLRVGRSIAIVLTAAVTAAAIVHLVVEGPRWQLVPVYVAALAVVVDGRWGTKRSRRDADEAPAARGWLRATGAPVGILLVAVGTGLAVVLPIPSLPAPDGPNAVGMMRWELVDTGRTEQYGDMAGGPRRLMATAWYPTNESGEPSPWVSDPGPFAQEVGPQVGVPGFVLGHLRHVTTPAITDAALAPAPPSGPDGASSSDGGWPVVVYSHGWAGFASIQSDLAERLASEGFVVLALDHTYGAAVTTFPDGTVAPQDPAALPEVEDVGQAARDAASTQLEATFADDVAFLLDHLAAGDGPAVLSHDDLALQQVGLVGHSTGAGAMAWLCLVDDRCAGLLGFDPWIEPVSPELLAEGVDVPLASVRSQDWQGNGNDAVLRSFHDASTGDLGVFVVPGSTHRDFTLLPFLSPAAEVLGLSGPVDARAMHAAMDDLAVAFFDTALRDGAPNLPTSEVLVPDP